MPYNQYEEIRNIIWQEEKKYLMKKVSFDLILNDALKIGDYILFSGKKSPYRKERKEHGVRKKIEGNNEEKKSKD